MDNAKNFAVVTLASGISAVATSATTVAGQYARLPAVPFNATIWNSTDYTSPDDAYHAGHAERVRVTAISTNTLTLTRAQENTSAVALNVAGKTYKMVAGLGAKDINHDVHCITRVAMTGHVIDIGIEGNFESISTDTPYTFSATPSVAGDQWAAEITNTDTVAHTLSFPQCKSVDRNSLVTSCTIGAGATITLSFRYNGTVTLIKGDAGIVAPLHYTWAFDPKAVCDGTYDGLFLMTVGIDAPNGFVVTAWKLSFEADPTTEIDLDLKRADAFIGRANSAVMDVLDTTAGASSESTASNINGGVSVANGKVIYIQFGTAYTEANHQCIFELWGYAAA